MKAFLTGSRIYSVPSRHSDIDLVVFMEGYELEKLIGYAEQKKSWWRRLLDRFREVKEYDNTNSASLRFGPLNLLCVTTQRDYDVWKTGTDHLKKYALISRATAVLTFKDLQQTMPISDDGIEGHDF